MKSISLKLQEEILHETEALLANLNISRNQYINEAIEFYNNHQKRKLLAEQIAKESQIVSEDSLNVLHEFENLGMQT